MEESVFKIQILLIYSEPSIEEGQRETINLPIHIAAFEIEQKKFKAHKIVSINKAC